jgi:hypothetical protein
MGKLTMANGKNNDKSLESWIWDAACSIRGAKDAPKWDKIRWIKFCFLYPPHFLFFLAVISDETTKGCSSIF